MFSNFKLDDVAIFKVTWVHSFNISYNIQNLLGSLRLQSIHIIFGLSFHIFTFWLDVISIANEFQLALISLFLIFKHSHVFIFILFIVCVIERWTFMLIILLLNSIKTIQLTNINFNFCLSFFIFFIAVNI